MRLIDILFGSMREQDPTVKKTIEEVQAVQKETPFLDESQFAILLRCALHGRPTSDSLEKTMKESVTAAKNVRRVMKAIARNFEKVSSDAIDTWIQLVIESISRKPVQPTDSLMHDMNWWPASFLSWDLNGRPQMTSLAFSWLPPLMSVGIMMNGASTVLEEVHRRSSDERDRFRLLLARRAINATCVSSVGGLLDRIATIPEDELRSRAIAYAATEPEQSFLEWLDHPAPSA